MVFDNQNIFLFHMDTDVTTVFCYHRYWTTIVSDPVLPVLPTLTCLLLRLIYDFLFLLGRLDFVANLFGAFNEARYVIFAPLIANGNRTIRELNQLFWF